MVNNQVKKREKDLDLKPIHPGEILREELLIPLKISVEQLAKSTQIKEEIIKEILAEKQDITPDISYRLGLFFDLRDDYWLSLQKRYELDCWKDKEEEELVRNQVLPYQQIKNSLRGRKRVW